MRPSTQAEGGAPGAGPPCARCGGNLEPGQVAAPYLAFTADHAKATFLHYPGVRLSRATACSQCGHVDLFIDPGGLAKDLSY